MSLRKLINQTNFTLKYKISSQFLISEKIFLWIVFKNGNVNRFDKIEVRDGKLLWLSGRSPVHMLLGSWTVGEGQTWPSYPQAQVVGNIFQSTSHELLYVLDKNFTVYDFTSVEKQSLPNNAVILRNPMIT